MPILAQFEGIIIRMRSEGKGKHNKPHVHVKYGEYSASYSIMGECLGGKIPPKKDAIVRLWIKLRQSELKKAALAVGQNKLPKRIDPLK